MKKATNIIFTFIMTLIIVFAFLIVGVRLFGLKPYTVLSGSMEPEYHVGSLIYVKKATAAELDVNVPITYVLEGGTVVTHRIIEVIGDEDDPTVVRYRTKGDANDDPDGELVHINNVLGRPVFTIPLLGYVTHFIQNPPGIYIMIISLALLVLLAFIPDLFNRAAEESKETSQSLSDSNKEKEALLLELTKARDELMRKQAQKSEGAPDNRENPSQKKNGDKSSPPSNR